MSKLDELEIKYPNTKFKYEPNINCKFCHGTGERKTKLGLSFCICTFVSHDFSNEAGDMLGDFAKRQLKEIGVK